MSVVPVRYYVHCCETQLVDFNMCNGEYLRLLLFDYAI